MNQNIALCVLLALTPMFPCAQDDENELRHIQIIQGVLDSQPDVDIDERSDFGVSSLMSEAHHGHAQAVRFLLARGANIVATDIDSNMAEDYAKAYGHIELAEELRIRRLQLDAEKLEDYTHANFSQMAVFTRTLPHVDYPINEFRGTLLMAEALHGHIHAIETLLRLGADPDIRDDYGKRARDYAGGNQRVIDALERAAERRHVF